MELAPKNNSNEAPKGNISSLKEIVNNANATDLYKNLKQIGEGAAGEVFYGSNNTGEKVAIKRMFITSSNLEILTIEITIMKNCVHENIVRFMDSFMVEGYIWIVMEFMDGGCLTDILEQFDAVKLSEPQVAYVCLQTLKALNYIHDASRIHRDIKSDNILLSTKGEVKLCDFGYAAQLTEEKKREQQ